eukprot:Platyproteum_vivax@DN3079_c0_g1_i1.p1
MQQKANMHKKKWTKVHLPTTESEWQEMLRDQFHKTKMCPYFIRGHCLNGNHCSYAHSTVELQPIPNLCKTKMCEKELLPNGVCKEWPDCSFAHSRAELRSTNVFYKTSLCNFYKHGRCRAGDTCRHAHGVAELRSKDEASPDQPPVKTEQELNNKVYFNKQNSFVGSKKNTKPPQKQPPQKAPLKHINVGERVDDKTSRKKGNRGPYYGNAKSQQKNKRDSSTNQKVLEEDAEHVVAANSEPVGDLENTIYYPHPHPPEEQYEKYEGKYEGKHKEVAQKNEKFAEDSQCLRTPEAAFPARNVLTPLSNINIAALASLLTSLQLQSDPNLMDATAPWMQLMTPSPLACLAAKWRKNSLTSTTASGEAMCDDSWTEMDALQALTLEQMKLPTLYTD